MDDNMNYIWFFNYKLWYKKEEYRRKKYNYIHLYKLIIFGG